MRLRRARFVDAPLTRLGSADPAPPHLPSCLLVRARTLAQQALGPHDPTDGCTPLGRVVDADCGHAVGFAGPLRHAGYPVRRGVRFILVLFLYVEGFAYGELLSRASEECARAADGEPERGAARADGPGTALKGGAEPKPSGDMPGGFVVYQQTTDLVKMLNRRVMSVLD